MFETLEDKFTKRTEPGPDASWNERFSWEHRHLAPVVAVFLSAGLVTHLLFGGTVAGRIAKVLVSTSLAVNVFSSVRAALRIRKKKEV
jgi:hypothetical protein